MIPGHLIEGATAHDKCGEAIEGDARQNYEKEILNRTYAGDYKNDEITSIGAYAFYGDTKITNVDVPNVTSIGAYALDNIGAEVLHFSSLTSANNAVACLAECKKLRILVLEKLVNLGNSTSFAF